MFAGIYVCRKHLRAGKFQLRIFVLGGTKPSRKVSGSKYVMGVLKTVIEYGLESFRGVNTYGLESFRDV